MLNNFSVSGHPEAHPALVLNADFRPLTYLPLSISDWKESICAVLCDRVTVIREHNVEVHSPSLTMRLPSVIALREYVDRKRKPSLTRHNLIVLRDRCSCAYCGQKFAASHLTRDHVIPKSRGGRHTWENIVACCLDCNQIKSNRTPEEARMPLLWRPWMPSTEELARADFFISERKLHEGWKEFLPYVS